MTEPKTQREKEIYLKGYKDAEKAYGACHFCYGKGYSTRIYKKDHVVEFCACARGQQLEKDWDIHTHQKL